MLGNVFEDLHTAPSKLFEECALWLHDGHLPGIPIENGAEKFLDGDSRLWITPLHRTTPEQRWDQR